MKLFKKGLLIAGLTLATTGTPLIAPLANAMPVIAAETQLTITPTTAEILAGKTITLKTNQSNVTWKTSDPNIATVSNGVVTGKKTGTATITATANGKSATVSIKVYEENVKTSTQITNGVVKEASKYIWYENGKKSTKTGVYNLSVNGTTAWRYVKSGEVQINYTGIASNEHGTWYLDNGIVTFKRNGNVSFNGKTYYVINSKVAGEIVTNLNGWYEIHSAVPGKTNYVIDVCGAEFKNGAEKAGGNGNIQMYQDNNSIAQRFFFTHLGNGVYNLTTGTGDHAKRIDVVSGKKGANIRQWDKNTANAQKFRVVKNSTGKLSFINVATNQALDIEGNDSFENGRNVWDYPYLFGNDKGQNFTVQRICNQGELPFNPSNFASGWYTIRPSYNTNFSLDVNGNIADNRTKIQLWSNNGSPAQRFYIKNMGNGIYEIYTGSTRAGSAVDAGGANGKVHQWTRTNNNNNQKYKMIKYKNGTITFVNLATGKALDVAGGSNYKDGTNIQNYQHIIGDGLSGAEGQTWTVIKVDAPTGWVNNGKQYVIKNVIQKGLQKIGNTWYLFDKSNGVKKQSGSKIMVGSFFQTQSDTRTRFYVTLNGYDFVYSKNFAHTWGRDMNFIAKNGIFYGLQTGYSNPKSDGKQPYYDFVIKGTKDFKTYNWHSSASSAYTYTNAKDRWAPEWFQDTNGKTYVFYSVNKGNHISDTNETRVFTIYRSQATDLANYKFSKPVEMKFDNFPQFKTLRSGGKAWQRGFIDACVVKNGSTYVMFVKNEQQDPGMQSSDCSTWVYRSSDLTNWKLWYKIPKSVLPQTPVNGLNRYYEGQFVTKIGNTWHLYADEMRYNGDWKLSEYRKDKNGNVIKNADGTAQMIYDNYPSKIVHLTSTDLRNWTNRGYINTNGYKVRHGSIMTVNDTKSEEVIKNIFNK